MKTKGHCHEICDQHFFMTLPNMGLLFICWSIFYIWFRGFTVILAWEKMFARCHWHSWVVYDKAELYTHDTPRSQRRILSRPLVPVAFKTPYGLSLVIYSRILCTLFLQLFHINFRFSGESIASLVAGLQTEPLPPPRERNPGIAHAPVRTPNLRQSSYFLKKF